MVDNDAELARGLTLLAAEVNTPDVDVTAVIAASRARDRRRTSVISVFGAVVVVGVVAALIGFGGVPRPGTVDHTATSLVSPSPGDQFATQLTAAWPGIAPPGTSTTVIGGGNDPRTIPMRPVNGTAGYRARLSLTDAKGATEVTITVEPDPARTPPAPRCGPVDNCAFRTFADGTAATVAVDSQGNHFEALLRDSTYVTVLEQATARQGFLLDADRMFRMATVFTGPR